MNKLVFSQNLQKLSLKGKNIVAPRFNMGFTEQQYINPEGVVQEFAVPRVCWGSIWGVQNTDILRQTFHTQY